MIKYEPSHEEVDTLVLLLNQACKSVENQANWDKKPYSEWYYQAKKLLNSLGVR